MAVVDAAPSTSLEVHGKQEEEEVDLDSSLIWAIRYLECDAVEEMLSEGANICAAASASAHMQGCIGRGAPPLQPLTFPVLSRPGSRIYGLWREEIESCASSLPALSPRQA